MGTIDKWSKPDNPKRIYLIISLEWINPAKSSVKAMLDRIPEANKLVTNGVKKTMKNRGSM